MSTRILIGDCRSLLPTIEAESVSAIVTDPPYDLTTIGRKFQGKGGTLRSDGSVRSESRHGGFMGMRWDGTGVAFDPETWAACLRVLKPGGHLLAFGGARTFHRMTVAIEDAGFEIRDCLSWLYGSGFPKSHNLDGEWEGWGTALKPAWEPIIMARKPLIGTVAANMAEHSTGAINVDASRIAPTEGDVVTGRRNNVSLGSASGGIYGSAGAFESVPSDLGRWPANVVLDEDAAAALDEQTGERGGHDHRPFQGGKRQNGFVDVGSNSGSNLPNGSLYDDSGGASRFFYTAKASRSEREIGMDGMPRQRVGVHDDDGYRSPGERKANHTAPMPAANHHPTVKPIDLMTWLIRMVTPPGGIVLDPFMGSGTTGIAASRLGFPFIGIEISPEYAGIARRRIHGDAPLFADIA